MVGVPGRMWLASVAVYLLALAPCAAGEPKGPGEWRCWTDSTTVLLNTTGGDSLWFGSMGVIWRVDLKTDQVTTFTVLDGLPLDRETPERGVSADDGKLAVLLVNRVYMWRKGDGFVGIDLPNRNSSLVRICFDGQSRLHLLDVKHQRIYMLDARDQWEPVRFVPVCQAFVPVGGGFLLGALKDQHGVGFVDRKEGEFKPFNHPDYGSYDFSFSPLWLNNRMIFRLRGAGGKEAYFSVVDGELRVESTHRGVDLKTGKFLGYKVGNQDHESVGKKRLRRQHHRGLLFRSRFPSRGKGTLGQAVIVGTLDARAVDHLCSKRNTERKM